MLLPLEHISSLHPILPIPSTDKVFSGHVGYDNSSTGHSGVGTSGIGSNVGSYDNSSNTNRGNTVSNIENKVREAIQEV